MSEFNIDSTELPEAEMKIINERAEAEYEERKDHFKDDLLESQDKVPGQNFSVLSFMGEKQRPRADHLGLKVWGNFETEEQAKKHASYIGSLEENKNYNVFVMQMYNWSIVPPNLEQIEDITYHDEKLDNMVKTHNTEVIKARQMFDRRKEILTNQSTMEDEEEE